MRTICIKKCPRLSCWYVDNNLPASAGDMGSVSGQGTKIPHASWPKKRKHSKFTQSMLADTMLTKRSWSMKIPHASE